MRNRFERRAIQVMRSDPPPGWREQFVSSPTRRKVTCVVCGSTGYGDCAGRDTGDEPAPWQAKCLLGHPDVCEVCGRRFTRGGLGGHRRMHLTRP